MQTGGFYLADRRNNGLLSKCLDILIPLNLSLPDGNDSKDYSRLEKQFTDPNYQKIYDVLINVYKTKTAYLHHNNIPIYSHHLRFASLMFISYLSELELFMLIHTSIPCERSETMIVDNLKPIFDSDQYVNRSYTFQTSNIVQLLENFALTIDKMFDIFIDIFVRELCEQQFHYRHISIEEIRDILLVPVQISSEFDTSINITWKESLTLNCGYSPEFINSIIETSMKTMIRKYINYMADGTGMFSFMHLINNDAMKYYGSCITQSFLEMYIMSRLFVKDYEMKLVLQNDIPGKHHGHWRYVQFYLKAYNYRLCIGQLNFTMLILLN